MRILRVVSDLYPAVVGGIGIHAHEMSRVQSEKGNEVTVITFCQKNSSKSFQYNYSVIQIPHSFRIMGNSFSFSLPSTLRNMIKNYDIIHAHSHLFYSTFICAFLRKYYSIPLIITNHGLLSQTAPMWLQKIYMSIIGIWVLNSADRVISYTPIEKEQLVKYGIEERKITVIHNGISNIEFVPSPRAPGKQILWIGRFTQGKGIEILLEAFKIFLAAYPDYQLLMIGNGPLRNKMINQIRHMDLIDSIQLVAYIPNQDLPQFYQNSAIFILPSFEEGVPRTILEAMACGIPIVCTNLPQLVDIVKGAGILVPVKDSQALANAIIKIISNPELAITYGTCGRSRVSANYSWNDTVEKTQALYRETLQSMKNQGESALNKDVFQA